MEQKIIGIGLNKTGTTSLGRALEILGYNYHYSWHEEFTMKYAKNEIPEIITYAKNYNNLEDLPWCLLYKELYIAYPNSKFILTRRKSPEKWLESQCKHLDRYPDVSSINKIIFGYEKPHFYKDEFISFYNKHNNEVRDFFKDKSNFIELCFEEGDGWTKLCKFLGHDIPKNSFPFLNRAPNFIERLNSKLQYLFRRNISDSS